MSKPSTVKVATRFPPKLQSTAETKAALAFDGIIGSVTLEGTPVVWHPR